MRRLLVLLALTASPAPAMAQLWVGRFDLGFARSWMDSTWASDRGMARSGLGIQVTWEGEFFRVLVLGMEAGGLVYDDKRPFSQNVVCVGDGCSESSDGRAISGLSIFSGAFMAGLQPPRLRFGVFELGPSIRIGWWDPQGQRGIGNCGDCTDQDLGLKGGRFLEVRAIALARVHEDRGRPISVYLAVADRRFASESFFPRTLLFQFGGQLAPRPRETVAR